MDVEVEILDLKRRVGELEGGFGFLTQQVQGVHRDLLGFQEQTNRRFDKVDSRFDKVDGRLDKVDGRLDKVDGRLDRVEAGLREVKADVASLRTDLPSIVGNAMREVLRDQQR